MTSSTPTGNSSRVRVDPELTIARVETAVYRVPTDKPEADGTIAWDSTTMLLVEVVAKNGARGIGFSYASRAAAAVVQDQLASVVVGCAIVDTGAMWDAMVRSVRNAGRPGVAATAISAVDIALWDLMGQIAQLPLFVLLGPRRCAVPVYGSGGFTTYSERELAEQLSGWVALGIPRVKMKVGKDSGTRPTEDVRRVQRARSAIGSAVELFVDANGAYTVKQAINQAEAFGAADVNYFEEPVSSDQLEQLAFIRSRIDQDVAAGEYGYDPWYFRTMLRAGAVDILQADVTRCLGVTGWLEAASIAHGFAVPFSAHTAPSIHAQIGCVAPSIAHVEYFHDHVRIEHMLFDGTPQPAGGYLAPDPSRPGLGLELKRQDAEPFLISRG
ncbi:MAG TPA: enolase C-terminal domain-like protein [Chloroflexota bacterium]|nr:enolase C-terminal domain-like protein [Chloroflexota bacterium]